MSRISSPVLVTFTRMIVCDGEDSPETLTNELTEVQASDLLRSLREYKRVLLIGVQLLVTR